MKNDFKYTLNKFVCRFIRQVDGNFAIITAIALPAVLLITLGTIDYSYAVQTGQKMKADAEAAVLAAVNETQLAYNADEEVDFKLVAETTAKRVFLARTGKTEDDFSMLSIRPTVESNVFTVEMDYRVEVPSTLQGLATFETHTISNSARAKASAASYININLIFDVSGSMGIGSTPADQQIVADATGCAFACHTGSPRGSSSYDKARAAGATMRIDTARLAALNAIQKMKTDLDLPDQVTVGLYKFNNDMTEILNPFDAKSKDLDHVEGLITSEVAMDIEGTGTNVELALDEIFKVVGTNGSGKTADDRIHYVVVLTDGIENTQSKYIGSGWKAHPDSVPNAPSMRHAAHETNYAPSTRPCTVLRDQGIQIYFINTEYIVPTTGRISGHNVKRFGFISDTLHDLVDVRMKQCTGDPDKVIRTDTPQEIATAFEEILGDVTTPLRLF